MTYSNTIPANVVPYVRAGSLANIADIEAAMPEAADHVYVERHLGEKVRPLVERWKAHRDLLDLIGRTEKENTEAVEMDPTAISPRSWKRSSDSSVITRGSARLRFRHSAATWDWRSADTCLESPAITGGFRVPVETESAGHRWSTTDDQGNRRA